MLKIGEFSKMSHLTIKALRFYEKEELLVPARIDKYTGYSFYETSQLETAASIKAYRQLDLSINGIKAIFAGEDAHAILMNKVEQLQEQKSNIDIRISIIKNILEEKQMKYQVTVKEISSAIVYYSEVTLSEYADMMKYIPAISAEFKRLNPDLKCSEPPYEFCEYLDGEHRDSDIHIRYNESVTNLGNGNENIKFREVPAVKVLSTFHKGSYENIGEAYTYIIKYAEENGYKICGLARECYINGIWNKESIADWLTEIQFPIEKEV